MSEYVPKKPLVIWATKRDTREEVKLIVNTHADLARALGGSIPRGKLDVIDTCRQFGYDIDAIIDSASPPKILYKPSSIGRKEIIKPAVNPVETVVSDVITETDGVEIETKVTERISPANRPLKPAHGTFTPVHTQIAHPKHSKKPMIFSLVALVVCGVGSAEYFKVPPFNRGISFSRNNGIIHSQPYNEAFKSNVIVPPVASTSTPPSIKAPHVPDGMVPVDPPVPDGSKDVLPGHVDAPKDVTPADIQKRDDELKKKLNIPTSEPKPIWDEEEKRLFKHSSWTPPGK